MSERLERLVEADLDQDQLAVYRSITDGPRASSEPLFPLKDGSGALNGPFGIMLHAPRLGMHLQQLGAAIRYHTRLSDRTREIAILKVAVATDSAFEWYAHERVGRAVGLLEHELNALREGVFHSEDSREEAAASFCDRLLRAERFDDVAFDEICRVLGHESMIEVTVLVGYYRTLAQMMEVFDVQAPCD
jgi:4-carboxymuconolactone decarboxylase